MNKKLLLFVSTILLIINSFNSPNTCAEEGIQSSSESYPMEIHLTSNINFLSFSYDGNEQRLQIGSVKRDTHGQIGSISIDSNGKTSEEIQFPFNWFNPNNDDPSRPFLQSNAHLLHHLGFRLPSTSGEATAESTVSQTATITLEKLFAYVCDNGQNKREQIAVEILQQTYSLTEDQARHALKESTQKIQCTFSPVELKNPYGKSHGKDQGRWNLAFKAIIGDQKVDSGAKVIVVAPEHDVFIVEEPCWCLSTTSDGKTARTNIKVGTQAPLYAHLAILGLEMPHSSSDGNTMIPGTYLDKGDTARGGNIGFTFGRRGVTPPSMVEIKKSERQNETGTIPQTIEERYSAISEREKEQTALAIKNNPELGKFMDQILDRKVPGASDLKRQMQQHLPQDLQNSFFKMFLK